MIFDSLIRFHEGEENSATEMAEVMQELRALAHAGATLVLLHQRAKSETSRYRGSSDIAGGVDTAISISRDRKAGLLTLECFKSRYVEEFSLTLRPDLNAAAGFEVTAGPKRRRNTRWPSGCPRPSAPGRGSRRASWWLRRDCRRADHTCFWRTWRASFGAPSGVRTIASNTFRWKIPRSMRQVSRSARRWKLQLPRFLAPYTLGS